MDATLMNHWKNLFKPLFPEHAYLRSKQSATDLIIAVDWTLRSEKGRPYKRSCLIRIVIERAVIENYLLKNADEKELADKKIFAYVQQQLESFSPDHDTEYGEVPPQVEWRVAI
jgi:hypothetical protein